LSLRPNLRNSLVKAIGSVRRAGHDGKIQAAEAFAHHKTFIFSRKILLEGSRFAVALTIGDLRGSDYSVLNREGDFNAFIAMWHRIAATGRIGPVLVLAGGARQTG